MSEFAERLNEQVGDAFAASQQYLAMGVYYRTELLPRLAAVCYERALDERDRALAMVRYLVDAGMPTTVPGIPAPESAFADVVAPLELAVARQRRMSERAGELVLLARAAGDHGSEQFLKRLIGDQSEGLASLRRLLTVVRRSRHDPFRAEHFLAGEPECARFVRPEPVADAALAVA